MIKKCLSRFKNFLFRIKQKRVDTPGAQLFLWHFIDDERTAFEMYMYKIKWFFEEVANFRDM